MHIWDENNFMLLRAVWYSQTSCYSISNPSSSRNSTIDGFPLISVSLFSCVGKNCAQTLLMWSNVTLCTNRSIRLTPIKYYITNESTMKVRIQKPFSEDRPPGYCTLRPLVLATVHFSLPTPKCIWRASNSSFRFCINVRPC